MTTRESEFLQKLRATFLVEAREHLQIIASGLLALEKASTLAERADQLEIVFRHTHSLKGAARAVSFLRTESVCQGLEEVFALCKRRGRVFSSNDFDVLHRAFDMVGVYVEAGDVAPTATSSEEGLAITRQLQAMVAGERDLETTSTTTRETGAAPSPQTTEDTSSRQALEPTEHVPAVPAPAVDETVRLATAHLDRVLVAAEEMLVVKQASALRSDELQRIEGYLDEWGKHWTAVQAPMRNLRAFANEARGSVNQSGAETPEKVLEFLDWTFGYVKSLEQRIRTVATTAVRDRHLVSKQVDELLKESKSLLMMPFASIAEPLPKLVRDLARDQGKEVDLQVIGGEVRLDKRVLEQLKDPLLHLVRNAIDHGIETPAKRSAANKPARASLMIEARLVPGNRIEVVVADDGGGIDQERLLKAAVSSGVVSAMEARDLSDAQIKDLAFRSTVTTSPIITEISGRGLGLPIVRDQVEKLGGHVSFENRSPVGVTFRINLSQSLSTFRGVFVRAGGQTLVIPTSHVERVARLPRSGLKTISGRDTLSIDGQAVAVAYLQQVLELPMQPAGLEPDFVTVVLIGSGHGRIALAVEEVLYDEEVLVKRLQRPLVRVRNIAGATVLPSGQVLPILNVADLLKSARRAGESTPRVPTAGAVSKSIARKVLVAEDSITSRLLLKGILETAGCEVRTVVDGIEAFTALRSETFDLLVSDIEMPRLNGFDLTARIRADRSLADLPVILVTALSRREDRERGIDVGANAYITKGGFDQRDLVEAVRRLAIVRERT